MSKIKFLITLGSAIRNGAVKTIQQAVAFAKREFGKVDDDFLNDIINVFKKEGKTKKGDVVPIKKQKGLVRRPEEFATRKEYERYLDETLGPSDDVFGSPMKDDLLREWDKVKAKNVTPKEGIETLDDFNLSDSPLDDLEKIVKGEGNVGLPKNPKRPGGSLDPVIGMTRGLARKILDKKGIEIGKADPIDVFENTIGFDVLTDVRNLGEEIVEAENIGRRLKPIDELLEMEGLFDVKIPKNPVKGMTNEELNKELISQVGKEFQLDVEKFAKEFSVSTEEAIRISKLPSTEQQKILQKYINQDLKQRIELSEFKIDPDRKPNADGGLIDILKL